MQGICSEGIKLQVDQGPVGTLAWQCLLVERPINVRMDYRSVYVCIWVQLYHITSYNDIEYHGVSFCIILYHIHSYRMKYPHAKIVGKIQIFGRECPH